MPQVPGDPPGFCPHPQPLVALGMPPAAHSPGHWTRNYRGSQAWLWPAAAWPLGEGQQWAYLGMTKAKGGQLVLWSLLASCCGHTADHMQRVWVVLSMPGGWEQRWRGKAVSSNPARPSPRTTSRSGSLLGDQLLSIPHFQDPLMECALGRGGLGAPAPSVQAMGCRQPPEHSPQNSTRRSF